MNRVYIHLDKHMGDFSKLLNYPRIVVDLETTSLNPRQGEIVGLAFAVDSKYGFYITDAWLMKEFGKQILSNPDIAKIFHNAIFDLSFLKEKGYEVAGDVHDTMVLAHLIDPDRKEIGLKALSRDQWGDEAVSGDTELKIWLESNGLTKAELHRAPQEILTKYAAEDALNTFGLFHAYAKKLKDMETWLQARGFKKTPLQYYKEEYVPLFRVVRDMQLTGVRLDLEACATMQQKLEDRVRELDNLLRIEHKEQIIAAEALLLQKKIDERLSRNKSGVMKKLPPQPKFNFDSNDHLKTLLFRVYKLPITKKTLKGNVSLNAEYLQTLLKNHPWAQTLLEYKELQKSLGMYFRHSEKKKGKPLLLAQEGGIIHASFNLIGTATGRFSSSNPNLQNLPKHGNIKSLFVPRQGKVFVYADYSQLELRVAAHLSQDPILLRAYREGLDLHQETATAIGCTRDEGKRINFAIIYNAGGWRIAEILGLMTNLPLCQKKVRDWDCECEGCAGRKRAMRKGDEVIRKLFGKYVGLKKYVDKQMDMMLKYHVAVSEFGRVRRLKNIGEENVRAIRNHDLKSGFNLPIQSFGASLCKRAMVALHSEGYAIINQIHDSILVETEASRVETSTQDIKSIMENVYTLSVPLLAEPKTLTSFEEKGS